MATYKEIHGVKVQYRDSDATAIEGDVWYNKNTGLLKMHTYATGAWATGGDLTTGKRNMGLTGTLTAAIAVGGMGTFLVNAEKYDGTSWTEVGDLNQGVEYNIAFGTSTAAINAGGNYSPGVTNNTEIWNGASWTTSPADMNTARMKMAAANQGTTTAGLIFGGSLAPVAGKDETESWNGSAWTEESGDLNTARLQGQGGGTSTAAFMAGGYSNPPDAYYAVHEQYDGSTWSEESDLNTGRQNGGSSGTVTSALVYAGRKGSPGPPGANTEECEQWDGTSWTEVADLSITRQGCGRGTGASGHSAICTGFDGSPNVATEQWDQSIAAQTVAFD